MKKKTAQKTYLSRLVRPAAIIRLVIMISFAVIGGFGIAKQVEAQAQTAADYCAQYDKVANLPAGLNSLDAKNACSAGLNGQDCSEYVVVVSQSAADVCNTAAKAKADGLANPGSVTVTTSPSTTPSTSTSPSTSPSPSSSNLLSSFLDQQDSSDNLSDYIDTLHASGQDAKVDTSQEADDNYGSYVNGAGKQQKITVYDATSGGDRHPAIVWFNGGGWHADDGTAYCLATGSPKKNCAPSQDGGGDSGVTDKNSPPAGGGANARGYTVISVTYRLGSSGVYYMFEDVMRGLQHVINNADKYHIDPSKIAVGGDSAGGSLSMRVAASGKSGAKVGIGWSAPTNAYTGLFKSYKSLLIGMDHSTCIPTDLAGLTNFTDLLNGGSGDVAQYGQGLSSNDFSSLGITQGNNGIGFDQNSVGQSTSALGLLTQVLTAGQYAFQSGNNIESISQRMQSEGGGMSGMSGSVFNLASKKLNECIDNFNALSPALFASPMTPPSFLAGYDTDDLIDPQQAYDMRDKLISLGIKADAKILPGSADAGGNPLGASNNHLGYDPDFVCLTLNFVDSIISPEKGEGVNCETGVADNAGTAVDNSGGGGGGGAAVSDNGSPSGGSPSSPGGEKGGNTQSSAPGNNTATARSKCESQGGKFSADNGPHGGGVCKSSTGNLFVSDADCRSVQLVGDGKGNCVYAAQATGCDTWDSSCNGNRSLPQPTGVNPNRFSLNCQSGYSPNNSGTRCIRNASFNTR